MLQLALLTNNKNTTQLSYLRPVLSNYEAILRILPILHIQVHQYVIYQDKVLFKTILSKMFEQDSAFFLVTCKNNGVLKCQDIGNIIIKQHSSPSFEAGFVRLHRAANEPGRKLQQKAEKNMKIRKIILG